MADWADAHILALFSAPDANRVLLVDSIGGWVDARIARMTQRIEGNYAGIEAELDDAARAFADAMIAASAHVVAVGEEVGWGIVPLAPSARLFRDVLGRMQQRLAAGSREAFLVVSGFAIDLRAAGRPVS